MAKFEKVNRFEDVEINLPKRSTKNSAGYDFEVAEDTIIPSYTEMTKHLEKVLMSIPEDERPGQMDVFNLDEIKNFMAQTNVKPTLVPTGVKCKLASDEYLELSVRSSTPLKYWLIMGNSVGRL